MTDLFEYAASLRDRGMGIAADAEDRAQPDFAETAYAAICHVARRQVEVHVDHVLAYCKVKPSHANAWGAVWRRAIKDGVLLKSETDAHRPCLSDPHKHAHSYRVYKSGLFYGGGR